MLSKSVNLAIVDDHTLFRKTLASFLSSQKNISVPVQASDVFDLITKLKGGSIDVLLMDIFMPELSGTEAIKLVREKHPDIKILVLSMSSDLNLISDIMDMGILGYMSKSDEPEELIQAIEVASDNRIYRNRWLTEALYWNKQNKVNTVALESQTALNDREKRILELIWEEKSNKEIADELFLGVRSVEKIRQDIKEKIGVKSTVGLLKYAINKRIIKVIHVTSELLKHTYR